MQLIFLQWQHKIKHPFLCLRMSTIFFTENNKLILLISVFQYVYFIHWTAPVYSQGWSICGKKGIQCFLHQAFSPTSCHSLQKYWTHTALLPAGSVVQLLCQTGRGHLYLPLDASLGCKTMLGSTNWVWAAPQSKQEACLVAGKRMCRVLSVCLPPGLTGPLLPSSAGKSSMDKYTNGFRWTFEDIVGMKRVFKWILEVRDHSLRGRLCKMWN